MKQGSGVTTLKKLSKKKKSLSRSAISNQPTLDEVVVALQKSFSRVSTKSETASSTSSDDAALALVTGPVEFNLTLRVDPDVEGDVLRHNPAGAIQLSFSGAITPDIRVGGSALDSEEK